MDDLMKSVMDIVKAQASVRQMSEDDILAMIKSMYGKLQGVASNDLQVEDADSPVDPALRADPKKSIKESSVVCLECGAKMKILTSRHLAKHGLSTDEYLAKWGFKKNTPLSCKSLARDRRKKMTEMRLWERRHQQPK